MRVARAGPSRPRTMHALPDDVRRAHDLGIAEVVVFGPLPSSLTSMRTTMLIDLALGRRAAVLALALVAAPAQAQSSGSTSLEATIRQHSPTTIEGYIQPLADVLVANLSRGYFSASPVSGLLRFSVDAIVMSAVIDDGLRTYTASTPPGFVPETFETPTIFGGQATPVQHSTVPGLSYRGSDGLVDGDYFPTAVPQLRVGGLLGTELAVRYFTSSLVSFVDEEDFPELKLFGLGLRHSLNRYFIGLPFDLSVAVSYSTLTLGDMIDLSGNSVGVQVGKWFGMAGVFAGLSSEGGSMNLTYTSTDPLAPGQVDFDVGVSRSIRLSAGGGLRLGFLNLFGEAGLGDVTTFAAGLRFGY